MTATDSVSNSIKALFSLSFAAPLYGVELGIRAGRFAKSGSGRAVDALTAVTQSMVSQLTSFAATVTPPAPQQMLFSLINEIQKSVTGDLSRAAAGDLSGLSVDGEQLKEMLNKWRIFVSVPFVKRMVGLETSQSLRESVEKSYAPGPYIALWYVEGVGHWYGDTYWQRGMSKEEVAGADHLRMRDAFWEKGQSGMLGDAVAGTLPAGIEDGSLTMLNAGIGLSIAQSLLSTINHLSPMSDVRRVVEKCVSLCKNNATPGFEGAAIESIGLVTRSALFSGDTRSDLMVPKVAQAISDAFGPEELGYFWHGVGRAHYFAPPNLIPVYGSIEHGFEMIKRLVKSANGDDDALQSALAGFWWAVTVVNMRNPQVLAGALKRLGTAATGNSGFTNGVMSTTIMRQDTTPDADFIDSFINYCPKDSALASIWKDAVADPARRAKDTIWPILKKRRELGQVFRFQNLTERAG